MRIFNNIQQAESRNGHGAVATTELAFERRKDAIKSGLFYGLPVAPILETRADAHCTRCRADFFFPEIVAHTTLHRTRYRKREMKHTHTHTHTHTQRAANCYGSLINLCSCQNRATLTPIGLRSKKKKKKKIDLHFLSRCNTINGLH